MIASCAVFCISAWLPCLVCLELEEVRYKDFIHDFVFVVRLYLFVWYYIQYIQYVQYPQKKLRQQPNFSRFLTGWLKKRVADIKQLFADLGSVMHLV